MTDRIDLIGIEVRARHGALPEERTRNQLFLVDVGIFLETRPAAASDALSDTLDYGVLMLGVHYMVAGESHNLIETVANRVAALVLEHPRVERVIVTVHKPQAPVPLVFGDVSVTVDRTR